mgnify:CR=1 FL=1
MTYVIDIDGTICESVSDLNGDYRNMKPLHTRIEKINELYDYGHKIVYFTARGMGRHNNNQSRAIQDFYSITESQLESWGAKYHQLMLGKPAGDVYIDDKGVKDIDFFK